MTKRDNFLSSEHLIAALSYVGILVLIPIISGDYKKPFVQFHVKQGLVILGGIICSIIIAQYFPRVGALLFLAFFVTTIVAFFQAVQGNKWRIFPV
ncbi:MAG: hypothetical protein K8Q97_02120 [Candidatus Andersenbacteria bacterium]|nr:hypothetical protein [Candidatus Andersenbacteria bacterium]